MQITETQIAQVNKQIKALLSAESFYGKKLEEAGVTSIQSAEDFQKLPFSEKNDLRNAYPLGLMTAPEELDADLKLSPRDQFIHLPVQQDCLSSSHIPRKMLMTGLSCSNVVMKWPV